MERQRSRIAARAAAALAFIAGGGAEAFACSCPPAPPGLTDDAAKAWHLDRAPNVARLRVTGLRAGTDTLLDAHRVVEADVTVLSTVKGSVPSAVKLTTLFGIGDCGLAPLFLAAIAWDRPITLSLQAVPEHPHRYYADMCGYAVMDPASGPNP